MFKKTLGFLSLYFLLSAACFATEQVQYEAPVFKGTPVEQFRSTFSLQPVVPIENIAGDWTGYSMEQAIADASSETRFQYFPPIVLGKRDGRNVLGMPSPDDSEDLFPLEGHCAWVGQKVIIVNGYCTKKNLSAAGSIMIISRVGKGAVSLDVGDKVETEYLSWTISSYRDLQSDDGKPLASANFRPEATKDLGAIVYNFINKNLSCQSSRKIFDGESCDDLAFTCPSGYEQEYDEIDSKIICRGIKDGKLDFKCVPRARGLCEKFDSPWARKAGGIYSKRITDSCFLLGQQESIQIAGTPAWLSGFRNNFENPKYLKFLQFVKALPRK